MARSHCASRGATDGSARSSLRELARQSPFLPTPHSLTHTLAKVRPDGLPEPDYNETLAGLDLRIIQALEESRRGLTVIVETFGGRRNYYAYLRSPEDAQQVFASLEHCHPEHALSLSHKTDAEWTLFEHYRQRFPW